MATNDPGLAPTAADTNLNTIHRDKEGVFIEDDRPVAPDQFDARFETSKWEIW